ncbi:MAG: hypothetical protein MMC33_006138 [Icmadophila ericetorum]|nr:hypothetical protein [Icmadophila ericetorum]
MTTRILVASLGNPAPYTNTLHSAGHTLLEVLREELGYPQFAKDRALGKGLVSRGAEFTLWQSPSYMNVSGKSVAAAYKGFLHHLHPDERATAKLIIVHDELESAPGKLKLKKGGSAKGHNGLKSCITSLGGMEFMRLGVGIGRPEGRDRQEVANYVLRKMTPSEMQKIKEQSGFDDDHNAAEDPDECTAAQDNMADRVAQEPDILSAVEACEKCAHMLFRVSLLPDLMILDLFPRPSPSPQGDFGPAKNVFARLLVDPELERRSDSPLLDEDKDNTDDRPGK